MRAVTLLLAVHAASAWLPSHPLRARGPVTRTLRASAVEESAPPATAASGPEKLKRERYVATNRFTVRDGKDAKFEKRWATRKSRLAELDGFRWFHLMRRVKLDDDDPDYADPYNYVSFTIWKNKGAFNAWRNGEVGRAWANLPVPDPEPDPGPERPPKPHSLLQPRPSRRSRRPTAVPRSRRLSARWLALSAY